MRIASSGNKSAFHIDSLRQRVIISLSMDHMATIPFLRQLRYLPTFDIAIRDIEGHYYYCYIIRICSAIRPFFLSGLRPLPFSFPGESSLKQRDLASRCEIAGGVVESTLYVPPIPSNYPGPTTEILYGICRKRTSNCTMIRSGILL